MKYVALQSQVNVSALMSASYRKESQSARTALHNIFTSVQYPAQQGIELRGHNESHSNLMQLLLLRSTDSKELRQWLNGTKYNWLSHEVINEIIEMMAMMVLRKIVQKIKTSKFYAIVMDETTDLSRKEQVRFSLRFFSTEDWEIYEEFIGFCYDGARNVSGKFTGIQARVKDREPRAEFVHCAARSLNLATQDAMHNIQECRHMFLMVKELTNAFRESPKHDPTLLRKRKSPRWLDHGSLSHTFSDPKEYFHQIYVGIIDACKVAIEQRFPTESFTFAVKLEKLITEAANGLKQDMSQ
nr:uncharacterized protein LOC106731766 [Pelodiscus sinensis]|eukprot:XP_025038823.1 uncharacterized protein LOC106731766 [Pelodiscus sinensis]